MCKKRIEEVIRNHDFDVENSRISKKKTKKIDKRREIKKIDENKKRSIVGKRSEENIKIKQYEKNQSRENVVK